MGTAIQVDNLTKAYGGIKAINNLSFSVGQRTVFGLLGANGAGKSSTIECVLGTRRQDEGNVSILGMDPQLARKALFEKVGVQFQQSHYQDKIRVGELCEETCALYKYPADAKELLRQFGMADKLKSQAGDLSGGERQRLFIVLALIPAPSIVFLDELTTGLDTKARRDVWKCLAELKQNGLTVCLTSHYMDEVEALCDRILILKKGTAVFSGTVQAAIESTPFDRFEDAYLWYAEEETENEGV